MSGDRRDRMPGLDFAWQRIVWSARKMGWMIRRIDRGVDAPIRVGRARRPFRPRPARPRRAMGRMLGKTTARRTIAGMRRTAGTAWTAGQALIGPLLIDPVVRINRVAGAAGKMAGAARRARKPLAGIIRVEALIRAAPLVDAETGWTGRPQRSRLR